MPSNFSRLSIGFILILNITRCLSHSDDLDEISLLRSRTHADALIEECDFDTLWKEYGLINVLVVLQLFGFICT